MAELIGAVSAVNQLLETAISLIKHFRRAYERQQDLRTLLDRHLDELRNIRDITRMVEEEAVLQTTSVNETLVRLRRTGDALVAWLNKNSPEKKGRTRQFTHQLLHGSSDQKSLSEITNELSRLKTDLSVFIQVAHVGVTQIIGNTVFANSEIVRRIDERLVLKLGKGKGLEMAELLKGRSPRNDGPIQLHSADIASLDSREVPSTKDSQPPEIPTLISSRATIGRIIIDNVAQPSAVQVNVPIQDDIWKDKPYVEIRGNRAEQASKQFNYPVSMDAFLAALNFQPK